MKQVERWKATLFCSLLWFAIGVGWMWKNYSGAGVFSTYTLVVALPGLILGGMYLRRALKERRQSLKQEENETTNGGKDHE